MTPADNLKTRMMQSSGISMFEAARTIHAKNSFPGFFNGTMAGIAKPTSSWLCLFATWSWLKNYLE